MKRFSGVLIILVLIGLIITAGCSQGTPKTTSAIAVSPTPTQQTQFNENEPASDGNLRITVIRHYVYAGSSQNLLAPKTKYLQMNVFLKLENLRSDKTFHILGSDFSLLDNGNVVSNAGSFYSSGSKFDLIPGDRQEVDLVFTFPEGTEMRGYNKLKFDFSGSSGGNGKIVYFNL